MNFRRKIASLLALVMAFSSLAVFSVSADVTVPQQGFVPSALAGSPTDLTGETAVQVHAALVAAVSGFATTEAIAGTTQAAAVAAPAAFNITAGMSLADAQTAIQTTISAQFTVDAGITMTVTINAAASVAPTVGNDGRIVGHVAVNPAAYFNYIIPALPAVAEALGAITAAPALPALTVGTALAATTFSVAAGTYTGPLADVVWTTNVPGLSFAGAVLSGTPTTAGPFTVTATPSTVGVVAVTLPVTVAAAAGGPISILDVTVAAVYAELTPAQRTAIEGALPGAVTVEGFLGGVLNILRARYVQASTHTLPNFTHTPAGVLQIDGQNVGNIIGAAPWPVITWAGGSLAAPNVTTLNGQVFNINAAIARVMAGAPVNGGGPVLDIRDSNRFPAAGIATHNAAGAATPGFNTLPVGLVAGGTPSTTGTVVTGTRTANHAFNVYIPRRFLDELAHTPHTTIGIDHVLRLELQGHSSAVWSRTARANPTEATPTPGPTSDPFRVGTPNVGGAGSTQSEVGLQVGQTVRIPATTNSPLLYMTLVSPTVIQVRAAETGNAEPWSFAGTQGGIVIPIGVSLSGTGSAEISVSITGGSHLMPQPTVVSLTGPSTPPGFTAPVLLNGTATTTANPVVAGGQATTMIDGGARSILITESTARALSAGANRFDFTHANSATHAENNLMRGITFALPNAFVFAPPRQGENHDPLSPSTWTWTEITAHGITNFLTAWPVNSDGARIGDIFPSQRAAIEHILVQAGVIPANSQAGIHSSPLILRRPANHPQATTVNVQEGPLQQITFNNDGLATNLGTVWNSTEATGGQFFAARNALNQTRYAFFSNPSAGGTGSSVINVITHGITETEYNLNVNQMASITLTNFGVGHANPIAPTFPGAVNVNVGLRHVTGTLGGNNPAPIHVATFDDQRIIFERYTGSAGNIVGIIAGRTYDEHVPFDAETGRSLPTEHGHFNDTPRVQLRDTVGWAGGVGAHGANIGVALFPWTFTVTDANGNPHPHARLAGIRLNTNYDADAANARGFDNDIFHNVFGAPQDTWLNPEDSDNTSDRFTVLFGANGSDVMVANLQHPTQGQITLDAWFYLSTAPNFSGPVYVTASNGQGAGGIVQVANVTAPISVSTGTTSVQMSHARLPVEDIVITENVPGALRAVAAGSTGMLQIAINELPFTAVIGAGGTGGVNGFWPVAPSQVVITGNEGNPGYNIALAPTTAAGIQPYIALSVQRSSVEEGSTITLRDLDVALHNLGIGLYDLLVFGTAIADNGPEINTGLHSGMPGFRRYAFQGFVHPGYLSVGVIIDGGIPPVATPRVLSMAVGAAGATFSSINVDGLPVSLTGGVAVNSPAGGTAGRLYVPMAALFAALGLPEPVWNPATGIVTTTVPGAPNEIVQWRRMGSSGAWQQAFYPVASIIGGGDVAVTNAPFVYEGTGANNWRTLIPLRGLAEGHGLLIGYEAGQATLEFPTRLALPGQ
jgi:hypothetical protein